MSRLTCETTCARGVLRTRIKQIHFVGMGGIGMSSIAEVLLAQGFAVSGSDAKDSGILRRLEKLGAKVAVGHAAENLGQADVLVFSSVIPPHNPEYREAKKRGIPIIQRAEMLAELMRMKDGIAIAGSHGKTTTTSLTAWILSEAGLDPTCLVGGRLESFDSNARLGESCFLVAEADESDGSFLKLSPVISVITNIDPEHLDHYQTFEVLVDSFVEFTRNSPFYGTNILCVDHPVVRRILPRIKRRYVSYGLSEDADFRAENIRSESITSIFDVYFKGQLLGEVKIPLPGKHNVLNTLAAIACAYEVDVEFEVIQHALASFAGIDRRFQIKGKVDGVTVVDDYAHHPEEISATLGAAKSCHQGRVVALFQPHRYTRTRDLFEEFTTAFKDADVVYVCDIYEASEAPIPGVTAEALAKAIVESGHPNTRYVADKDKAASIIATDIQENDIVITLGAGDVKNAGVHLLELLHGKKGNTL